MLGTKIPKVVAIGALSLCACLSSLAAHATAVSATAQVQGLTDAAGLLTFSGDSYFVSATTPLHDSFQFGTDPLTLGLDFNDGNSVASATPSDFILELPYTNAGVTNSGRASSVLQWSMDWVASATGTAQINLDFLSSASIVNYAAGDQAGVSSLVNLLVDGTQLESEVFDFFLGANNNTFDLDTMSVLLPVLAGQHGSLTVTLASQGYVNPVPLPAAVWLLVSGLAGFGGLVRRRSTVSVAA
jgi:hypothetical protein